MNKYTLLCDFYELTMSNGYFLQGKKDEICYFDMFYRTVPDDGGFAIAAGLQQLIEYLQNLNFSDEDIKFLRSKNLFDSKFLEYLKSFKFRGDVWAVPEGTAIFPGEPVVTVRAGSIEAQFIETYLLLSLNHQTLIATKANRIVRAAEGRVVSEFGSRRAQGADASILGARAAYIAGCASSSNTAAEQLFDVPASGTMAHSWVQMFDSELEAFRAYCAIYPTSAALLVDTYNVLKSGLPNAISAFREAGISRGAIRLDSGDIAYLSRKARRMLNDAGLYDIKIVASNSLDEYIIRDILRQGAAVDIFGVGERLITSKSDPVFGGVYKLAAIERNGTIIPKIKISENAAKITNPHFKKIYRLYDNETKKAEADLMCLHSETVDDMKPLEIFDPNYTWKRKILENFTARELLVPIFKNGQLIYKIPSIHETREHCAREVATLWDEVTRFENPHEYYVDLSQQLWDVKHALLNQRSFV